MKQWRTKLTLVSIFAGMVLGPAVFSHEHEKDAANKDHQMTMQKCNEHMLKSLGAKDANFDLRFIDTMISHHEGAISMSRDALAKASHPELKKKAQEVIDAQSKEIEQLKAWRKTWYAGSQKNQ